jgi:hypothetical protein
LNEQKRIPNLWLIRISFFVVVVAGCKVLSPYCLPFIVFVIMNQQRPESSSSSSYGAYDALRLRSTITPLISSSPLGEEEEGTNTNTSPPAQHVGRNLYSVEETNGILCHVPIMFRWTSINSDSDNTYSDVSSGEAYGGSAAALLAMHHFNTGNSSIVPALKDIHQRCPIRLTSELLDSKSSGQQSMQRLTRILTRSPTDSSIRPQPCALLGSSWSSTTKKLATVTGVYDLPHITSSASSVDLNNMAEYPLFARTHPSDASMAQLSIDYLATQLHIDFVAVLYLDNAFGNSYNAELLKVAAQEQYHMTVVSESFRPGASDEEVVVALTRLQTTGYNYFLGVFFGGDYERIMTLAHGLGIAGPGKFWMFNGALASAFVDDGSTTLPKDSPAAKATFGNAILTDEGGLPGIDPQHDAFLQAWNTGIPNDAAFTNYLHSKLPVVSENIALERTSDFFETTPSHIAAFSYDAMVALGLSACQAYQEQQQQGSSTIFSGAEHHAKLVQNQFLGASGNVTIGPNSFSRKAESTFHVVSNILPIEDDTANTTITFRGTPLTVFDAATQQWTRYDASQDFVYADGSTTPPLQIPALDADRHYIGTPVRAVVLTLSAMAMALSIGFFFYCCLWRHKHHRVIRASQPLFLGMICAGTLLMASWLHYSSLH